MSYPEFICIGARKAGTTWLHENLSKQSSVYLPPVKEIHYLDHGHTWLIQRLFGRAAYLRNARQHLSSSVIEVLKNGGSYKDLKWAMTYCLLPRNDKWYRSLFPSGGQMCGEVCPGYAKLDESQVASVAKRMPHAKIIYFMRDPLECAWSSAGAHFGKKSGGIGVMSANKEAVKQYLSKHNSFSHLNFIRNIASWRKHYSDEQMLLSYFDDLKSNPQEVYRQVLKFLGLDYSDASIPSDIGRKLGTKEGRRSKEIPPEYARFLAELYIDSLQELNVQFDNVHTRNWLTKAQAVLDC